jgi:hypothetical protein
MTPKDEFDDLLHEALSEYRDAEPLTGIESRLLERLQNRDRAYTRPWLRWSYAAAALAVLVLMIWIGMARRVAKPATTAREFAAQSNVAPQEPQSAATADNPTIVSENTRAGSGPPKRTTRIPATLKHGNKEIAAAFPVPVPLTDQEQTFLAALNRHPEALRLTPGSDTAPVIAQIEIKPLSNTDQAPGENQ